LLGGIDAFLDAPSTKKSVDDRDTTDHDTEQLAALEIRPLNGNELQAIANTGFQ
jgi:hypothetical protein